MDDDGLKILSKYTISMIEFLSLPAKDLKRYMHDSGISFETLYYALDRLKESHETYFDRIKKLEESIKKQGDVNGSRKN